MRSKSSGNIKDILTQLIKSQNLEGKLDSIEVLDQINLILGKSLSKYIKNKYFVNGIIYIELSSSVLRNELMYKKDKLISDINHHMSKKIVTDIILK
tara:strand:+ start:261 stop:551 length:291 start_codon:yes stop_codon:yes gene_type:complete